MICYRDMTFCTFYKECDVASACPRPLTPEVQERADRWWGKMSGEPPIAIFRSEPQCFIQKESKKNLYDFRNNGIGIDLDNNSGE